MSRLGFSTNGNENSIRFIKTGATTARVKWAKTSVLGQRTHGEIVSGSILTFTLDNNLPGRPAKATIATPSGVVVSPYFYEFDLVDVETDPNILPGGIADLNDASRVFVFTSAGASSATAPPAPHTLGSHSNVDVAVDSLGAGEDGHILTWNNGAGTWDAQPNSASDTHSGQPYEYIGKSGQIPAAGQYSVVTLPGPTDLLISKTDSAGNNNLWADQLSTTAPLNDRTWANFYRIDNTAEHMLGYFDTTSTKTDSGTYWTISGYHPQNTFTADPLPTYFHFGGRTSTAIISGADNFVGFKYQYNSTFGVPANGEVHFNVATDEMRISKNDIDGNAITASYVTESGFQCLWNFYSTDNHNLSYRVYRQNENLTDSGTYWSLTVNNLAVVPFANGENVLFEIDSSVIKTINDLTDVLISGVTDGQVLTYVNATSDWRNQSLPAPTIDTASGEIYIYRNTGLPTAAGDITLPGDGTFNIHIQNLDLTQGWINSLNGIPAPRLSGSFIKLYHRELHGNYILIYLNQNSVVVDNTTYLTFSNFTQTTVGTATPPYAVYLHFENNDGLDTLANVVVAGVQNNESIIYNSSNQLWENKIAPVGPVPTDTEANILGGAYDTDGQLVKETDDAQKLHFGTGTGVEEIVSYTPGSTAGFGFSEIQNQPNILMHYVADDIITFPFTANSDWVDRVVDGQLSSYNTAEVTRVDFGGGRWYLNFNRATFASATSVVVQADTSQTVTTAGGFAIFYTLVNVQQGVGGHSYHFQTSGPTNQLSIYTSVFNSWATVIGVNGAGGNTRVTPHFAIPATAGTPVNYIYTYDGASTNTFYVDGVVADTWAYDWVSNGVVDFGTDFNCGPNPFENYMGMFHLGCYNTALDATQAGFLNAAMQEKYNLIPRPIILPGEANIELGQCSNVTLTSLNTGNHLFFDTSSTWVNRASNQGQVKVNNGNGLQPTYVGLTVAQAITYASPLGVSSFPTSSPPLAINNGVFVDADIYDFVGNRFLEQQLASTVHGGQIHVWRFILDYSNKAVNNSGVCTITLSNALSGFQAKASFPLPQGLTAENDRYSELITIADDASKLPAVGGTGAGYDLTIESTTSIDVTITSIARIALEYCQRA